MTTLDSKIPASSDGGVPSSKRMGHLDSSAHTEEVDESAFLAMLDSDAARELRSLGQVREYRHGHSLFHELQATDAVFVLLVGHVKISRITDDGREVMLALLGPGDVLGERSMIDESVRSTTAAALDDVQCLVISATDFRHFLETRPRAALALLKVLSIRLHESEEKRMEVTVRDATTRLAARIVELSDRFGQVDADAVLIDLALSQEDLAGWAGCSREAVAKALCAMRDVGWIETRRRRLTVRDLQALRTRCGKRCAGAIGPSRHTQRANV